MAIDRRGINSLEEGTSLKTGAESIKLEGDVRPGVAKLHAMPEEMKMADLDNIPGWWLQDLDELIQEYIEDTGGDKPRTLNDLEKWHRWKYDQTQAPGTKGTRTASAKQLEIPLPHADPNNPTDEYEQYRLRTVVYSSKKSQNQMAPLPMI